MLALEFAFADSYSLLAMAGAWCSEGLLCIGEELLRQLLGIFGGDCGGDWCRVWVLVSEFEFCQLLGFFRRLLGGLVQ